ncbi:MAG: FliM/FliN family flagellar motor switch protein [Rubellimicrobium sp.]|nr:FliM/FliN family flagellar motor switch protein [Rubellimicrobium sp.]
MAGHEGHRAILARMVSRGTRPEGAVLSPTRALRIALTRAAETVAGLGVTALGAADDEADLADLLARVGDDWLFLRLDAATGPGIAAFDPALLMALVEMQTCGCLMAREPDARAPTAADAALAEPLVGAFLDELAPLAAGTALDGWPGACVPGPRLADRRVIGLVLPETRFRIASVSAWLGTGERQGAFLIGLPVNAPPDWQGERQAIAADWRAALGESVMEARLSLDIVLDRVPLPLESVADLVPGQVLPLPGVQVTGARVETARGLCIGAGRLGQSAGMRALRLERASATEPEMLPRTTPGALPALDMT